MKNKHDEIKDLLKATRNMLSNSLVKEETERIKKTYGMLTEEDVLKKYNVGKAIEDSIEDDEDEEKDEYEVSDDNKEKETGITIHYVNEHYDEGEFIFQKAVNIEDCKTAEEIAHKIHELEHQYFPEVIGKLITNH